MKGKRRHRKPYTARRMRRWFIDVVLVDIAKHRFAWSAKSFAITRCISKYASDTSDKGAVTGCEG